MLNQFLFLTLFCMIIFSHLVFSRHPDHIGSKAYVKVLHIYV